MNKKWFATLTAIVTIATGPIGMSLGQMTAYAAEGDVSVTITKYVEGQAATASSTAGAAFTMNAAWSATNIGTGSGQYPLAASNAPTPYQAKTVDMSSGANYATDEDLTGSTVGASCSESKPFALVGYTTGNTMEEAAAGTPSMTAPAFTGLTASKFVIVWNDDCAIPPPPTSVKVTINKYVDGMQASSSTAANAAFPMNATSTAGNGTYELDADGYNGDPTPYQAKTSDMAPGSDYATNESLDGSVVGASCSAGKPFALVGYTTGDSAAEAAAATPTSTAPSFTGLTHDKFVIVWNHDCSNADGTIGGDVTGGTAPEGTLAVTSVETVNATATADGSFEHGWKYVFNVTVPDDELNLAMKFADWTSVPAGSSIAAANNIRISSAQANNSGATVLITAANTYSSPALVINGDLDPNMAGKQVKITVEAAVPASSANGSYVTSYGIRTQ